MDKNMDKKEYYLNALTKSNIDSINALNKNLIPSPAEIKGFDEMSKFSNDDNSFKSQFSIYYALQLIKYIRKNELTIPNYNSQVKSQYQELKKLLNEYNPEEQRILQLLDAYAKIALIKANSSIKSQLYNIESSPNPDIVLTKEQMEKTFLDLKQNQQKIEALQNNSSLNDDVKILGKQLFQFNYKTGRLGSSTEYSKELTKDNWEKIIEKKLDEKIKTFGIELTKEEHNALLNEQIKSFCKATLMNAEIFSNREVTYGEQQKILEIANSILESEKKDLEVEKLSKGKAVTVKISEFLSAEQNKQIGKKYEEIKDIKPEFYSPKESLAALKKKRKELSQVGENLIKKGEEILEKINPQQKPQIEEKTGPMKGGWTPSKKAFGIGAIVLTSGIALTLTPILAAYIGKEFFENTLTPNIKALCNTILENMEPILGIGIAVSITAAVITTIALQIENDNKGMKIGQ